MSTPRDSERPMTGDQDAALGAWLRKAVGPAIIGLVLGGGGFAGGSAMFATPGDVKSEVAALRKEIGELNEKIVRMDKKIVRLTVLVEGRRGADYSEEE